MKGGTGWHRIPSFFPLISFGAVSYACGARNRIFSQVADLVSVLKTLLLTPL
jgi:hypothetical protein